MYGRPNTGFRLEASWFWVCPIAERLSLTIVVVSISRAGHLPLVAEATQARCFLRYRSYFLTASPARVPDKSRLSGIVARFWRLREADATILPTM